VITTSSPDKGPEIYNTNDFVENLPVLVTRHSVDDINKYNPGNELFIALMPTFIVLVAPHMMPRYIPKCMQVVEHVTQLQ
jgi:hypothetical protein